jgi:hypothetical protein
MNDIATKLISGQIDTLQALLLARENATGELKDFIEKELDGYPFEEDLPQYRKFVFPIVLDYVTPWGDIHRGIELDTTAFNKLPLNSSVFNMEGFNMNQSLFYDDIGFIQNGLNSLSSDTGIRPLNAKLLELLSKVIVPNHPGSKIVRGGHKFHKQHLQSLLDSVKKELIKKLQDQPKKVVTPLVHNSPLESQRKTVFVSYAWESIEENKKVISFVNFLREKGYDARMDKYLSQMETAVNLKKIMHDGIYNSDKVVVLLSETYKRKADNLKDGVGEEVKLIQEEIARKNNKYILVSFKNLTTQVISEILPNALIDREVLDLKKDQDERDFSELFSKLNSTPIMDFSNIAESTPEVKKEEIEKFKL